MALGRFTRLACPLALAAALAGVAPPAASASDFTLPNDSALARLLLRWSPLLFDIAVQAGRSFAEISYDRRGYDPVTNTFFVSGLRLKRDTMDVSVGRLRTDFASVLVEKVDVDTRALDLPPQLREGLERLGRSTLGGDFLFAVRSHPSRSAHDVALRYHMPDLGAFELTATIDNFHVLVPLSDVTDGRLPDNPTVAGNLVKGSLAYEDYGLMSTALDVWADEAGIRPDMLKAGMLSMPMQLASQLTASLPGGVSDALRGRIFAWADTAEEFLRNEDAVRVTLAPAEPVSLELLQAGMIDEALIVALNPSVTRGFGPPAPAPAASGTLAAASALISGAGAPQDREEGARTLLGLAAAGDLDAVAAIGRDFGDVPPPDLSPDELAGLYGNLLVARAMRGGVEDWVLDSLVEALPGDAVLAAERAAAAFHAAHGDGDIGPETAGTLDAAALRAAAYDHYEGRGVTRSHTRALALALVAAAAGDPFAASLRDRLTAAAQRDGVVLDMDAARAEAAALWAARRAARE